MACIVARISLHNYYMKHRAWALGIAVLVHGAALLLLRSPQWTAEAPQLARASLLVFVTPAKPVALPPQRSAPTAARQPRHAEALSVTLPITVPVQAATPATEPLPVLPEPQPASPLPGAADIMAQARRDLHKIDKELLGSAKAVSIQRPDSLQARLARGIESAFVGATSEVTDHYTATDGVVYSRVTRGGRSTCFMNGASTLAAATGSGGKWTQVNCPPPDSGWVR